MMMKKKKKKKKQKKKVKTSIERKRQEKRSFNVVEIFWKNGRKMPWFVFSFTVSDLPFHVPSHIGASVPFEQALSNMFQGSFWVVQYLSTNEKTDFYFR